MQGHLKGYKFGTAGGRNNKPHRPGEGAGGRYPYWATMGVGEEEVL